MILYKALKSKVLTAYLHCVSFEKDGAFRGKAGVLMTAFTLTAKAALHSGVENQEHLEKHEIDRSTHQIQRNVS